MADRHGNKSGGRKKGTTNKTSRKVAEICDASGELKPAEYLLKVMHDKKTEQAVKIECAKHLLPYTDRKMPTEIEKKDINAFQEASVEELEQRLKEIDSE